MKNRPERCVRNVAAIQNQTIPGFHKASSLFQSTPSLPPTRPVYSSAPPLWPWMIEFVSRLASSSSPRGSRDGVEEGLFCSFIDVIRSNSLARVCVFFCYFSFDTCPTRILSSRKGYDVIFRVLLPLFVEKKEPRSCRCIVCCASRGPKHQSPE